MNKILSVLFAGLLTTQAYAAAPGIPVVDPTAIAQMVQQLTQLQQMYSQLQAQYNTAVNTLNNFTGTEAWECSDTTLHCVSFFRAISSLRCAMF